MVTELSLRFMERDPWFTTYLPLQPVVGTFSTLTCVSCLMLSVDGARDLPRGRRRPGLNWWALVFATEAGWLLTACYYRGLVSLTVLTIEISASLYRTRSFLTRSNRVRFNSPPKDFHLCSMELCCVGARQSYSLCIEFFRHHFTTDNKNVIHFPLPTNHIYVPPLGPVGRRFVG